MIPVFGEKILNISEAQAETTVHPDGIADDFWREPMAVIERRATFHRTSLSVPPKLTMPLQAFLDAKAKECCRSVITCGFGCDPFLNSH
jgi:hypothetical protein